MKKTRLYINTRGKLVEDMRLTIKTSDGIVGRIWMSDIETLPCTVSLSSRIVRPSGGSI